MQPPRPTTIVHQTLSQHIRQGDHVIDATAGNGHDTLFLAHAVGDSGHVHAFDVQPQAIQNARERIEAARLSTRVTWHTTNHNQMTEFLPADHFSTIVFNLGYLPGGDHKTTTQASSTRSALQAASTCLRPGGLLTVLCYPGHPEGAVEATLVASHWPTWSDQGWRIACYSLPFTKLPSPILWLASKP